MDISTVAGLVLNLALLTYSIMLGAPLSAFYDLPSVLIVFGGTAFYLVTQFSFGHIGGMFTVIKKTVLSKLPSQAEEIARLVNYANLARREGLLALEEKVEEVHDEFQAKGLRMVIDGLPADTIRGVLENELYFLQDRHSQGKKLLDTAASAAPAMGMLGTLIGLVAMLRNMSDPSAIGVGMAVALITTFYGSFIANVIALPLAGKLERKSKDEVALKTLMIEGVLAIQAGDKPQLVEERLKTFLSPRRRALVATDAKK
ncbi:MAG: motility protein A [Planctomycetes bacterium]|nr:motility protein A [Planctomycetota bacterium]